MTPMVGKFSVIAVLVGLVLSPLAAKAQTDLWKFLTDQGVEATKVRIYPFNPRGALALACDAGRQAGSMWTARRAT